MTDRTTSPAFYEETIRKLRAERQQAIDALRGIAKQPSWALHEVRQTARAALLSLGEQP